MQNYKPLALQIAESMRAWNSSIKMFQDPFFELRQNLLQHVNSMRPLSLQIEESMRMNLRALEGIKFGNDFSRLIQPTLATLNQFDQTAKIISDQLKLVDNFKIAFPKSFIDTVRLSSIAVAVQTARIGQTDIYKTNEEFVESVSEIGNDIAAGNLIQSNRLDAITATLERIESTLRALELEVANPSIKLLSFENIKFYLEIIVAFILFIIPYLSQLESDEKLETIVENQTELNEDQKKLNDKLEGITEKIDSIANDVAIHRRPHIAFGILT